MMSNKAWCKVNLRALDKTLTKTQNAMNPIPTILISSTPVPRRSGRVIIKLDQFMYLE